MKSLTVQVKITKETLILFCTHVNLGRYFMHKISTSLLLAALALFAAAASAQDSWQGAYPPPPSGNYGNYNGPAPYNNPPPRGYNRDSGPAPYGPPPGYSRNSRPAPYGPPPRYYGDNRYYRGGPPRGYRYSRRNKFFDFPGGGRGGDTFWPGSWRDEDGRGPWDIRTFTDPERFWDDMLATPDYMPTMPGGWNVPSVSMPNPVEVGREIGEQAPDMIDTMRDY